MQTENFYEKHIKNYLCNRKKTNLSVRFYLSVIIIAILNIYLASNPSNSLLSMLAGGSVSFLMLIISFYFGYLGLIINVLFSLFAISRTVWLWTNTNEEYLLLIITFQIAVIIASFFISHLFELERSKQRKLEWLSSIDGLTEVFNHRYFQQKIESEMERTMENGNSLGLVMIDIDNFKKYNDTLGHKAGDVILQKTAEYLKNNVKEGDMVFRYGGDEFAVLLLTFDKTKDTEKISQIVKSFTSINIVAGGRQELNQLTLSMGLSVFPGSARNKDELIDQADNALYQAKNAGRNRIQIYQDTLEEIRQLLNVDEQKILGNLRVLLVAISAKDAYTLGHSERVSNYVFMISKALGLTIEEIKINQLAALLHDIGKIEIPENVLKKRGQLSKEEMELIKNHPVYSAAILEPLKEVNGIIPSVRHHHERYDGLGYPDGLSGERIPMGARILSVADAFDAMLSDRPYRRGMNQVEAMHQLVQYSGTQFDPKVVNVFIQSPFFLH